MADVGFVWVSVGMPVERLREARVAGYTFSGEVQLVLDGQILWLRRSDVPRVLPPDAARFVETAIAVSQACEEADVAERRTRHA
jgi:hypothetical protein